MTNWSRKQEKKKRSRRRRAKRTQTGQQVRTKKYLAAGMKSGQGLIKMLVFHMHRTALTWGPVSNLISNLITSVDFAYSVT